MGKKLELAKSQYFFGIMDKSRERERKGEISFLELIMERNGRKKRILLGKKIKVGY